MALNGNTMILLANFNGSMQPVAGIKTNELKVEGETIEVASATQGQWREFIAGRKEWELTTNYLLLASTDMEQVLKVGGVYPVIFRYRPLLHSLFGTAIMTSCSITATRGNLITGSFKLKGTGGLTFGEA